ncbi:MAG: DUF58 domain-containing protein [Acidimicrobiales bacterium]
MPTRRGWLTLLGSIVVATTGRLLGILELFVLAAGGAALALSALAWCLVQRAGLDGGRVLHPSRLHAGDDGRVDLLVRNSGPRRTPLLGVQDPSDGLGRTAKFLVGPLRPGETARASYRLSPERRGVFEMGPLQLLLEDPFGLARVTRGIAGPTGLIVYPRVVDVAPVPDARGHDPLAGVEHISSPGSLGEDLYGLRAYEVGDDLRRVHWPATAHLGDLMIRQNELPWQGRTTVVLDVRARAHAAAVEGESRSLELAVSAAASIVRACRRQDSLLRLVTTDGVDSGAVPGAAHAESIFERLAVVGLCDDDRFTTTLAGLRRAGNAGTLVVITTEQTPAGELEGLARMRGRFGRVLVVAFAGSSYRPEVVAPPPRHPPGVTVVRVLSPKGFADAWNGAVGRGMRNRGNSPAPAPVPGTDGPVEEPVP